jgi:hypothetical protein
MFNFYRQPTSGRVCLGGPASSWARCYVPASYGRRGPLGRRERVRAIHRTAGTECIAFIRELRADDGRTLARGVNSRRGIRCLSIGSSSLGYINPRNGQPTSCGAMTGPSP